MSRKARSKSVSQLVGSKGRARSLSRNDAFTAYAMDRLLRRLGQSRHAKDFLLKGGVLIANLLDSPHRFTRDIDVLRRRGRPSPDDLRGIFREIAAVEEKDDVTFPANGIRAVSADHDEDGYDGVKVHVRTVVGNHEVDVRVDVGFGDAVVPPPARVQLAPFLDGDVPASVLAYQPGSIVAEKVETIVAKFPAILHRLKDILDVVTLADVHPFDGGSLAESLHATFKRRKTVPDLQVLDEMHELANQRHFQTAWATMVREKAVRNPLPFHEAIVRFDGFVQPLLMVLTDQAKPPTRWSPDRSRWE